MGWRQSTPIAGGSRTENCSSRRSRRAARADTTNSPGCGTGSSRDDTSYRACAGRSRASGGYRSCVGGYSSSTDCFRSCNGGGSSSTDVRHWRNRSRPGHAARRSPCRARHRRSRACGSLSRVLQPRSRACGSLSRALQPRSRACGSLSRAGQRRCRARGSLSRAWRRANEPRSPAEPARYASRLRRRSQNITDPITSPRTQTAMMITPTSPNTL